ncbi:MAG TPA: 50S ribosomal protein L30 [Woeseiaceae bacterium]|jgi:large subunit ribosomal protein L30|nr:50S ribosomal protein L30 [Woeseiaceae bacterium]
MAKSKQLKVTLVKSRCGRLKSHRDCVAGLGLRKIRQSVTVADTPAVRGMIDRVSHLVTVEEVNPCD